MSLIVVVAVVV